MTLDEIPEVEVDLADNYKFIVAELTDSISGTRLVLRAKQFDQYEIHANIFGLLKRDIQSSGLAARCIGGGRIRINLEAKTIRIWDDSGEFGEEPDRQQTIRMLQTAFPEFGVTGESCHH